MKLTSLGIKTKLHANSRNQMTLTDLEAENARKLAIERRLNIYTLRKYSVNLITFVLHSMSNWPLRRQTLPQSNKFPLIERWLFSRYRAAFSKVFNTLKH